ncbi:hypothetical protein C1I99_25880 [Micromonospora deserti]|uniref:Uncharacterized protein n=1 Tax=Micromonospora deserti TaxID=2070366 RepID=A0A2W2BPA5_9ACTN|nr:hypothetical protein C1I99_25880 [Micromonospora deserti]
MWMNRPDRRRVSGSDQDRSTVVTRVAVHPDQAVLPWTGRARSVDPQTRTWCPSESSHPGC